MAIVFKLTLLGGAILLILAIWPGVFEDVVFEFPFGCFSFLLLGGWFLLLIGSALWELFVKVEAAPRRRSWGMWSTAVMFTTMALLWYHVPQRLAFALCYSQLRGLLDSASVVTHRKGEELGQQIGPYWVDRYGQDSRGGVYFRTHSGPDGIGPDEMSYGFVFQPNDEGTPFGNAHYRCRHLFGDWFAFAASDDW